MKYFKSIKILLTASLLLIALEGFAQESKIAVVDMEKIFKGYYKTKINSAKFKKQAATYKAYADNLANSQLKLEEEFRALRDASQNIAFSETERESKRLAARDKYRQLQTKQTELQQYDREKSTQLKKQYDQMRKELLTEIRKNIAKYAKKQHYSIVLDASGKTMNDIPLIIYYQTKMDITEIVITRINKGARSK
jgi:outer membrane protein